MASNPRPELERNAAPAKAAPYRRKLSNLLLDKPLQLRYVAFVTLLSAIISGSLGYLIWKQEHDASRTIIEIFDASVFAEDPLLKEEIVSKLTADEMSLVLTMLGAGLGLVIVLSLDMIVMTHKVAGPLYKLTTYFEKMAAGRLGEVYDLRRGDMLQGFYEKFRDAHQAVRSRHRDDNAVVGRFLDACAQAGVGGDGELQDKLAELRAYHDRREQALR